MKLLLLPFFLLLFFSTSNYAQLTVEPYVGMTASSIFIPGKDKYMEFKPFGKYNLLYGLKLEKPINQTISIKAGTQWVTVGGIVTRSRMADYFIHEVEFDFIQLLLGTSIHLKEWLYLDGGGYIGYLKSARYEESNYWVGSRKWVETNDPVRKLYPGLQIGIGATYKNIDCNITFLQEIFRSSKSYQQVLQFSLGYILLGSRNKEKCPTF